MSPSSSVASLTRTGMKGPCPSQLLSLRSQSSFFQPPLLRTQQATKYPLTTFWEFDPAFCLSPPQSVVLIATKGISFSRPSFSYYITYFFNYFFTFLKQERWFQLQAFAYTVPFHWNTLPPLTHSPLIRAGSSFSFTSYLNVTLAAIFPGHLAKLCSHCCFPCQPFDGFFMVLMISKYFH